MEVPALGIGVESLRGADGGQRRNSRRSQQGKRNDNLRNKTDFDAINKAIFGSAEQSSTSSSSLFPAPASSFFSSKTKQETSASLRGGQRAALTMDLSKSKLTMLDDASFSATPKMGRRKLKAIRKKVKDRTKGPQWFDMSAPEITDKRKNDLETLKLRGALDTKSFYKRNTVTVAPKYFHVGKVVESAQDFYTSRVPKKQRKATIAEELMSELRN